jgi:hypothetical protein
MPTPTVAGSLPKTLKNENGAALMLPPASLVVIQAIGRGSTVANSNLYRSGEAISVKSNCTFGLQALIEPILNRYYCAINSQAVRSKNTIGLQSWTD